MLLALYVCGGQTDPAPLDEININLNLMDNDMVGPKENENMETGMANMEEGTENGMESGAEHYPKPTWEPSSTVYCAKGGQSTDPSSGGTKCNLDDGHFCCALKCCPPNTRCGPTSDGTCVHTETGMANMEEDRGNMESGEEHYPKPTWEPSSTVYCAHGGQSTDPSSGGTKCNLDNGHFCCALKCCPPNTRCGWTVNGTCIHDKPITWHQRNENMDSGMANMETGMANMEEDSGKKNQLGNQLGTNPILSTATALRGRQLTLHLEEQNAT